MVCGAGLLILRVCFGFSAMVCGFAVCCGVVLRMGLVVSLLLAFYGCGGLG